LRNLETHVSWHISAGERQIALLIDDSGDSQINLLSLPLYRRDKYARLTLAAPAAESAGAAHAPWRPTGCSTQRVAFGIAPVMPPGFAAQAGVDPVGQEDPVGSALIRSNHKPGTGSWWWTHRPDLRHLPSITVLNLNRWLARARPKRAHRRWLSVSQR
jgi:hypothetical protein